MMSSKFAIFSVSKNTNPTASVLTFLFLTLWTKGAFFKSCFERKAERPGNFDEMAFLLRRHLFLSFSEKFLQFLYMYYIQSKMSWLFLLLKRLLQKMNHVAKCICFGLLVYLTYFNQPWNQILYNVNYKQ